MVTHQPISVKAPKGVYLQYTVTVLKPNTDKYSTCLLCKNLTEAKRLYKQYVSESGKQDLVSLLLTLNREYKENTLSSDVVLCRSVGKK